MKQVLQHARTGEITVEEVPAPQLLPGCVLVRIAASVVSAGTERAASEFARKNLLQKAQSRPDLVRDNEPPIRFDEIVCSTLATFRVEDSLATGNRVSVDGAAFIAQALQTSSPNSSLTE